MLLRLKSFNLISLIFILLLLFSIPSSAQTKVANDPTRIGVGARILGMGKSYVGLADDLTGMFINPAALATVDKMQLTSMQGKFINEYNYLNFGSALPTRFGNIGVGYVGSNISFTGPAATTEVVDGVRIIPSTTEGVSYSFLDSVILFSWGKELKGLLGRDFFDDMSVGATTKVFALDLSGPGVSQGRASGLELDLGMTWQPSRIFKLGLVLQNALPFGAGGKISWDNGTEESLPSMLKPGLSLNLLGKYGWRQIGDHELTLNADLDYAPTRPEIPQLWHIGAEWKPMKLLALRVGVDQDYVGSGTGTSLSPANNMTAGVGLIVGQFRFDYAYHQYNQITDNDTNYFSLSYGVVPIEEEKGPPFKLLPLDKTVVFSGEVTVRGEALNRDIQSATVNNVETTFVKKYFEIRVPLKLGKNPIIVDGFRGKRLIDTSKIRILRLKKFKDVATDHWAAIPISILNMEGIINGYPDGTFRPDGRITRAEFTKLLMSTKGIENFRPRGKPFKDIRVDHWAANFIGYGARYGFVKGYPDRTFRPNNPVTRAEGVALITRYFDLPEPRSLEMPYSDVPGRYWAAKDIIKAYEAGILGYLTGQTFAPKQPLTRAEVAEMLSKAPGLKEKVDNYLDWEVGY